MGKSNGFKLHGWAIWLLMAVLALPLCVGLFNNQMVDGHDAVSNLVMALYQDKFAGDGQFLIRWASELNYGYGYPLFNFYPPGFFFLTLFLSHLTHHVILSINLITILFWIASGVGMFYWACEVWGEQGGVLSAVAYMYAPYHIQDIYVRSALGEFSSFAFFPWILFLVYKSFKGADRKYFLLNSLVIAGLIITHGVMFIAFLPIIIAYIVFLFLSLKSLRGFYLNALSLLLGLFISAFYWLPVVAENKFLNTDYLVSKHIDFHYHFVSFHQLFHLPWGNTADVNGISLQIGLIHAALAFLPLLCIAQIFRKKPDKSRHYFLFLSIFVLAVFIIFHYSSYLWEHLVFLRFIQFPWRFLTIVMFALSFLAGSFILCFNERLAKWALNLMVFLLVISPFKFYWPVHYLDLNQGDLGNSLSHVMYLGEGRTTPKWIKIPVNAAPANKFEFISGAGVISQYRQINAIEHVAQLNAAVPSLLLFHSFYFPGWRVYLDNQETKVYPDNPYGLILFAVSPGNHNVRVAFGTTPDRDVALKITFLGMALFLVLMCWGAGLKLFKK